MTLSPRLLNRRAAAAYCGVSTNTFLAHVPVAPKLLGAKRLWDVRDIDKWLDGLGGTQYSAPRDELEFA
jgi:hypothetical protein